MGLSVKERGRHMATFRYVQVALMETLARWVPTTPEMEAKLLFGGHIWDMAQHADEFGKRTYELRLPLQHSLAPIPAYGQLLSRLAGLDVTTERIAGFYDVIIPGLDARYREYLRRTDQLVDAPTVRIMERVLVDFGRITEQSRTLRSELGHLRLLDAAWVTAFASADQEAGTFVVDGQAGLPGDGESPDLETERL
jgi:hypothetical protein